MWDLITSWFIGTCAAIQALGREMWWPQVAKEVVSILLTFPKFLIILSTPYYTDLPSFLTHFQNSVPCYYGRVISIVRNGS